MSEILREFMLQLQTEYSITTNVREESSFFSVSKEGTAAEATIKSTITKTSITQNTSPESSKSFTIDIVSDNARSHRRPQHRNKRTTCIKPSCSSSCSSPYYGSQKRWNSDRAPKLPGNKKLTRRSNVCSDARIKSMPSLSSSLPSTTSSSSLYRYGRRDVASKQRLIIYPADNGKQSDEIYNSFDRSRKIRALPNNQNEKSNPKIHLLSKNAPNSASKIKVTADNSRLYTSLGQDSRPSMPKRQSSISRNIAGKAQ